MSSSINLLSNLIYWNVIITNQMFFFQLTIWLGWALHITAKIVQECQVLKHESITLLSFKMCKLNSSNIKLSLKWRTNVSCRIFFPCKTKLILLWASYKTMQCSAIFMAIIRGIDYPTFHDKSCWILILCSLCCYQVIETLVIHLKKLWKHLHAACVL